MKWLPLLLGVPFLFGGCGWNTVSPYDPVVEERVTQLAYRTDEVLADGDKGRLSLPASRIFLKQSLCTVQALKERDLQTNRRTSEVDTLEDLEKRYQVLLARKKPLRSSVAAELRAVLWDYRYLQTRKRAFKEWEDANPPSLASDDIATPDNCSTRSNDHSTSGGHDHSSSGGHR
jgi:hypothetical protein